MASRQPRADSAVALGSPNATTRDAEVPQAPGAFGSKGPTAGDIWAIWSYRLSQYDEISLRSYILGTRELFDMRHPVRIPREYRNTAQEVRTPYVRDAALRVAAALTKDTPIPRVEARDETDQADDASGIAARWLRAAWNALDGERNVNTVYESARALVIDSESVLKVVDRPNAWANFPTRDADEDADRFISRRERAKKAPGVRLPFAAKSVDRLNMCFGDGEYGDEWAIEYGVYPAPLICGRYGMAAIDWDPKLVLPQFKIGGRPVPMGYPAGQSIAAGQTMKMEYFDRDWWAVVINGRMAPGFPKANPYKQLIHFRAVGDPVLYSLRYLVPGVDRLLTMQMNWANLGSFPTGKLKPIGTNQQGAALDMPVGDGGETPTGFKFRPGFFMAPPPGYDAEWMTPPAMGADVDKLVGIMRELIDIAGIPSILRGIGGARQAGYAVNQLMAAANLSFRQLGRSLSRQFERASEFMLDCVEDLYEGETVYVIGEGGDKKAWLGLKASGNVTENVAPVDMCGPVEFKFKPVIPTDEQALQMIGIQALNAPKQVLSHETVLRDFYQLEDPQAEMDRIVVEKTMDTDPTLNELMVDDALRKAGIQRPIPAPPPGILGPNGMPLPPSGEPPMQPDGQTAAGMPSIPGGTIPLTPHPGTGPTPNGASGTLPHGGGRPAGAFPGQPSGPERQAA